MEIIEGEGFGIILESVTAEGLVWKIKFCSGYLGQDLCTLLIYLVLSLAIFHVSFKDSRFNQTVLDLGHPVLMISEKYSYV